MNPPSYSTFFHLNDTWFNAECNDVARLLSLSPNNPQVVLTQIAKTCFQHPNFYSEGKKKMVIKAGGTLLESWSGGGEMAHLFLAASLTCSDKTARAQAAEIWVKGVEKQTLNSKLLGQALGKMETIEFFPLKRLTDIIQEFMFKISKKHDQALAEMIAAMVQYLPATPLRNTKKLLEIYREVLTTMDSHRLN